MKTDAAAGRIRFFSFSGRGTGGGPFRHVDQHRTDRGADHIQDVEGPVRIALAAGGADEVVGEMLVRSTVMYEPPDRSSSANLSNCWIDALHCNPRIAISRADR
jgi:hypothetical protein